MEEALDLSSDRILKNNNNNNNNNRSGRTITLGSTQPLAEMSTRNISWEVKAAGAYGWQPYHLQVPTILKFGCLNVLEAQDVSRSTQGLYILRHFLKPCSIVTNVGNHRPWLSSNKTGNVRIASQSCAFA